MDLINLDYSKQYSLWHQDTPESREKDIADWQTVFTAHTIFPPDTNARILDMGCGLGRLLLMLERNGYHRLKGVDVDRTAFEVCRREGLDVENKTAIAFLKQCNDVFDVVYAFDIFEHIEKNEQPGLFTLIHERLSDEGFLAIRIPNALAQTAMYFYNIDFTHESPYTTVSLSFLCKNAGFRHIVHRPQYAESENVRGWKSQYAKLLKAEFGIDAPILTPNIMTLAFKTEETAERYRAAAPDIVNSYDVRSTEIEALRAACDDLAQNIVSVRQENASLRAENETARMELAEHISALERMCGDMAKETSELTTAFREFKVGIESDISGLHLLCRESGDGLSRLERDMTSHSDSVTVLRGHISALGARLDDVDVQKNVTADALGAIRQEQATMREKVKAMEATIAEYENSSLAERLKHLFLGK